MAALALLLSLFGCAEEKREGLDPRDEPLLGAILQLAEIRILAQEHPDSAQVKLDAFLAQTDTTGMGAKLTELWEDPLRGRHFLRALHDSLQAPLRRDAGRARTPAPDEEGI